MREPPTARVFRTVGWTVALVVVLLLGGTSAAAAGDAPRSLRSTASDAAAVVLLDPEARRITDCARLNALTPDQVAAFLRGGGRHLQKCEKPVNLLGPKNEAEIQAQAANNAKLEQQLANLKKRTELTPEQKQALADADNSHEAQKKAQAAVADANLTLKKMQQTNSEASSAANAALQKQQQELVAKQEAATAAEQAYTSANNALENANAAKRQDELQAKADALRREEITAQRAEWNAQAAADAKARTQVQEELKAIETQRQQDVAQAEADRKQAALDQQLNDEALRKQREAARQQREVERQQREREAAARQKQFSLEEEMRLQREREAKEAAALRDAEEAEIKQREELGKVRDQEIAEATVKERDAKAEFQRTKDEQDATAKKYDELMKLRQDLATAHGEAEANAQADIDKANANAKQKEDDVPDEEKPRRDDEEECPPSPVDAPPKCENGGRCFQVKGKPATKRCSCGKGYKGDKCEHKPCPPPAKEGNMVNGKCVKWETEYFCPGCNRIWDLETTCHEIDTNSGTKAKARDKKSCSGLKEPENELYNRMCKFCLGDGDVKNTKTTPKPVVGRGGNNANATGSNDLKPEDDTTDSETRRRQLALSTVGPRYKFVDAIQGMTVPRPWTTRGQVVVNVPSKTFVHSVYEHDIVVNEVAKFPDLTSLQCIAYCYARMGAGVPATMGPEYCTWLLWEPPYRHQGLPHVSQCRIFNSNIFPRQVSDEQMDAPTNQPRVLPNYGGTAMLAFVTYPRVFDMFRPSNDRLRTRTIEVTASAKFTAHMNRATTAAPGEGTYVTTQGTQTWPGCVAEELTRSEAAKFYDLKNQGVNAALVQAQYDPQQVGPGRQVVATSPVPGSIPWRYRFDDKTRVVSVQAGAQQGGLVTELALGNRDDDSPEAFQTAFREIMRPDPDFQAGHLVAATIKPANWFFNYVPQHAYSNTNNGCWYRAEFVAKALMRFGCHVTYDVQVEYPEAAGDSVANCKKNFSPTKMSMDVQLSRGDGNCLEFAEA